MRKIVTLIILLTLITACSSVNAKKDTATYLESVDENSTFEAVKLVDKESGCKYLLILSDGYGGKTSSLTQMRDRNDKPLCLTK
jgi:uncharacterized protein YceK